MGWENRLECRSRAWWLVSASHLQASQHADVVGEWEVTWHDGAHHSSAVWHYWRGWQGWRWHHQLASICQLASFKAGKFNRCREGWEDLDDTFCFWRDDSIDRGYGEVARCWKTDRRGASNDQGENGWVARPHPLACLRQSELTLSSWLWGVTRALAQVPRRNHEAAFQV